LQGELINKDATVSIIGHGSSGHIYFQKPTEEIKPQKIGPKTGWIGTKKFQKEINYRKPIMEKFKDIGVDYVNLIGCGTGFNKSDLEDFAEKYGAKEVRGFSGDIWFGGNIKGTGKNAEGEFTEFIAQKEIGTKLNDKGEEVPEYEEVTILTETVLPEWETLENIAVIGKGNVKEVE